MMVPVRCFSCGQVIADKWEEYDKRVNKDKEDPKKVLDDLNVKRYIFSSQRRYASSY